MLSVRRKFKETAVLWATLLAWPVAVCAQAAKPGTPVAVDQKDGAGVGPTDAWDSFTVDIAVKRSRVDTDGKATGPTIPDVAYRWTREQRNGGWRTTITTMGKSKQVVQSLAGLTELASDSDLTPVRMEDDEDGTPVRLYNAKGKLLDLPTHEELRKKGMPEFPKPPELEAALGAGPGNRLQAPGREWAESFIILAAKKDARKAVLERKYGRAKGQIRGFDQFLLAVPNGQQELLVDREFNVPVESNMAENGELTSHATFSYDRAPGNSLVRRGMRIEHVLPDAREIDGAGSDVRHKRRLVSEVEFTNLRLEKKGGAR